MLTAWLCTAFLFVLDALLGAMAFVIPGSLLAEATALGPRIGDLMSYTPVALISVLMATWFAVQTSLHALVFAVAAYKLIPFKAS